MKHMIKRKLNLQFFATATETLQDLMQQRADVHDQMETLLNTAKDEGRDLTAEEVQEFENLDAQYTELDEKILAKQEQENRAQKVANRASVINSQPQNFRPAAAAGAPTQPKKLDDGGFKNLGEMLHAVRFGDPKGRLSELPVGEGQGGGIAVPEAFKKDLMPVRNEWSAGTGEDGGYMVPSRTETSTIWQLNPERSIVRPRATVIPAGDPPDGQLSMPALNQGNNGVYGGVEVQWINEGEEKPNTDATLREITLQPNEVAASTVVTDKLLRNWMAASSFISNLMTSAMYAAEDMAFLTGNGVGKPSGIVSAPGTIAVNRASANQVSYQDVVNMLANLYYESQSNAVWVASQTVLPQVATMQDGGGRYIYIQGDATKAIPSTLAGIPILFTGKTPTLGNKGDLMLVDFANYLIKDGSGPFVAASEHVLFKQNKTVIKVFWNVDGEPWVNAPLLLEDGSTTVSPYIVLDIPAAP